MQKFENPRIISILDEVITYYQRGTSWTCSKEHDYWVWNMKFVDNNIIRHSYSWKDIQTISKKFAPIIGKTNLISIIDQIYKENENPEICNGKYEYEIEKIYRDNREKLIKYVEDNKTIDQLKELSSIGIFSGTIKKFIMGYMINLGAFFYAEANYPGITNYKAVNYDILRKIINDTEEQSK